VGDLQTPSENLRLSIKIGATTIPNDKRRSGDYSVATDK